MEFNGTHSCSPGMLTCQLVRVAGIHSVLVDHYSAGQIKAAQDSNQLGCPTFSYLEPLNNAARVHTPGSRQFMNQINVGHPLMADAGKHVEVVGLSCDGVRNHFT